MATMNLNKTGVFKNGCNYKVYDTYPILYARSVAPKIEGLDVISICDCPDGVDTEVTEIDFSSFEDAIDSAINLNLFVVNLSGKYKDVLVEIAFVFNTNQVVISSLDIDLIDEIKCALLNLMVDII